MEDLREGKCWNNAYAITCLTVDQSTISAVICFIVSQIYITKLEFLNLSSILNQQTP
jgi:hypothetical protein